MDHARVRDVLVALERIAPSRFAFSFDKVGLQVGDAEAAVTRAAVSLDRSLGAIEFAATSGCQLLLSHHPLIFEPLNTVDTRGHVGKSVLKLAANDIAFVAAHTNRDSARGGINDELAKIFSLSNVKDFGTAAEVSRLKLAFYCPAQEADNLIDAVSEAGAGTIGAYRRCAFSSEGTGTFIGESDSNPSVGVAGRRETVQEVRIEMVLPAERQRAVTKALLKAHSYEEPAYDFLTCAPHPEQPAGRVGELEAPIPFGELSARCEALLGARSWAWGDPREPVGKVAFVGGAADSEWMNAQRAGADVLITGEVRQHVAVEASESGIKIIAAGHYHTEHPGSAALREAMKRAMPEIEWLLFTPEPGFHGRPA